MTIINDLREAEYHAMPALSATGAWQLVNDCPAIYWHTSPFNPDAMPPETSEAMDIGTALHLAVLEPDRLAARVALCPGDDWRTKAAREAREQAQASGLISLLGKHIDLVYALRKALLANEFVAHMLDGAQTEVSYFWDDEGIPCKARADIITRDGLAIGDLKSSANASPEFFQRRAFDAGHFLLVDAGPYGFRDFQRVPDSKLVEDPAAHQAPRHSSDVQFEFIIDARNACQGIRAGFRLVHVHADELPGEVFEIPMRSKSDPEHAVIQALETSDRGVERVRLLVG
jgi:hypothetical protein